MQLSPFKGQTLNPVLLGTPGILKPFEIVTFLHNVVSLKIKQCFFVFNVDFLFNADIAGGFI
jgi:hypothetical protein